MNRTLFFHDDPNRLFMVRVCFCTLFIAFGISACSSDSVVKEPDRVTVQLSWSHQAEFAGLYAAAQQGYYAEEELQVAFLEGGPDVDFITPLADGRAQCGISQPADVILARADGKPLRSVAAI